MDKIKWMRGDVIQGLLRLSDVLTKKAQWIASEPVGFINPHLLDGSIKDLLALRELCSSIHNRWENPILFRKFGRLS